MKVFSKPIFTFVLFVTLLQPLWTNAQVPFKISPVLNISFSDSFATQKDGFINTYYGGDSLQSYEINYFNTVVVKISDEETFSLALKGFIAGKFAGEAFKPFDLRLTDTLIGNLPGFFISGTTNDTAQAFSKFDCFVTTANSNSYWFFYYLSSPTLPTTKAAQFYSSIQFKYNKIKEATFKIRSFKKHKAVGEVWYISPELDEPMPSIERKKKNSDKPYTPQLPPMPPIDRKRLVKASKLASDFSSNRSLAYKKYTQQSNIVVEGIVKEIREPDEHGIAIIILDGGTSKLDIPCEILNARRIENLKKGMKATVIGHCTGSNGNVLLSKCIYIENPTYE